MSSNPWVRALATYTVFWEYVRVMQAWKLGDVLAGSLTDAKWRTRNYKSHLELLNTAVRLCNNECCCACEQSGSAKYVCPWIVVLRLSDTQTYGAQTCDVNLKQGPWKVFYSVFGCRNHQGVIKKQWSQVQRISLSPALMPVRALRKCQVIHTAANSAYSSPVKAYCVV